MQCDVEAVEGRRKNTYSCVKCVVVRLQIKANLISFGWAKVAKHNILRYGATNKRGTRNNCVVLSKKNKRWKSDEIQAKSPELIESLPSEGYGPPQLTKGAL